MRVSLPAAAQVPAAPACLHAAHTRTGVLIHTLHGNMWQYIHAPPLTPNRGGGNTQELTEMLTRNEIPRDIYDVWFDKYLLKGWLVILKWEVETYPVPNVR